MPARDTTSSFESRRGTSTVHVQFVGTEAVYYGRGWIYNTQMASADAPKAFDLVVSYVDKESNSMERYTVARTTDGIIDASKFAEGALEFLRKRAHTPAPSNVIDLTSPDRIALVVSEPPARQTYPMRQEWVQLYDNNGAPQPRRVYNLEEPTTFTTLPRAQQPCRA